MSSGITEKRATQGFFKRLERGRKYRSCFGTNSSGMPSEQLLHDVAIYTQVSAQRAENLQVRKQ